MCVSKSQRWFQLTAFFTCLQLLAAVIWNKRELMEVQAFGTLKRMRYSRSDGELQILEHKVIYTRVLTVVIINYNFWFVTHTECLEPFPDHCVFIKYYYRRSSYECPY